MKSVYTHNTWKHRPKEGEAKWFKVERALVVSKEGKKKWKGAKDKKTKITIH
jgi:hypothetical protein